MVNKVILLGRLGTNPDKNETSNGNSVTNLNVATSNQWTDDNGNRQEETEWHDVVVFGAQADACAEYLSKGRQVYVEGRLQTNEWQDDDGNDRYSTEILARNVQFLSDSSAPEPGSPADESDSSDSFEEDDIPF